MSLHLVYRLSGWVIIAIWVLLLVMFVRRPLFEQRYKVLYLFVGLMVVLEVVYMTLAILQIPTSILDYFYRSIEVGGLGWYLQAVVGIRKMRTITLISITTFVMFQVISTLDFSSYFVLGDYGNFLHHFALCAFSFGLLIYMLRNSKEPNLLNKPDSNFVLSIFLIFLTDIIFISILYKFALQQGNTFAMYATLIGGNLLKSLFLLLFGRGVWLLK